VSEVQRWESGKVITLSTTISNLVLFI